MDNLVLKNIIDSRTFENISLPRISSGWTECYGLMNNKFLNGNIPEGTYFDESIVIDEYANFLKNDQESIKISNMEELKELINSGEDVSISFSNDEPIKEQIQISNGQTVTFNLNDSISTEGNVGGNGRLFQVNDGKLIINGNGKTITSSNDSYGVFRVESDGELVVNNTNLVNSKGWGLNIKVLGGIAELNNVNINSTTGGGIEVTEASLGNNSKSGLAILNNCNFTQSGYKDHCSTCLSVSGGSKLIVNSGTYISENYCLYVFSSGGIIEVNNGTFKGDTDCIRAEIDLNTYPSYNGGLKIYDGSFTGNALIISPAYMNIYSGSFSFDPSNYIDSYLVKVSYDDNSKTYMVSKK